MAIYTEKEIERIEALEADVKEREQLLRRSRGSPEEREMKAALMAKLQEFNTLLDKKSPKQSNTN
jgi:hypothetical protein